MKKKMTFLCLSLATLLSFGFAACEKPSNNNPITFIEQTAMTLSYDETIGTISWEEVTDAKKYVIIINLREDNESITYETTELFYEITLKAGISLITVKALDSDGNEIGLGAKTVSLEFDFGAPNAPENLVYDASTGVLSWDASEHAAKYTVTAMSYTDETYSKEEIVSETSVQLSLGTGVYGIEVLGETSSGAKGATSYLEWASYTDENFNTDVDNDGVYNIISFENEGILELSRKSDYKGWDTGVIRQDATASITNDPVAEDNATAEKVLLLSQPTSESSYFEGVTFRLSKQIPIESLGILSFEVYRTTGNTVGVMYEDENGVQVNRAFSWSNVAGTDALNTYQRWGKITTTAEALLKQNQSFAGIKEITFYANNATGGDYYFKNVQYDPLGDVSEITYDKESRTVSWNAVRNAVEYVLEIDGETVYIGADNFYVSEIGLDVNSAVESVIKVTALDEKERAHENVTTVSFFGEVGELSYDRTTATVSWNAVDGAERYRLSDANGEILYEGTEMSYTYTTAPVYDFSLTLTAIRGESERSSTSSYCFCLENYGDETCSNFALSTGATDTYYIADFKIHNYTSAFSLKSGASVLNCGDGICLDVPIAWNSRLTYVLPKVIASQSMQNAHVANIASISFRYKKTVSSAAAIVYFYDVDGNEYYLNLDGSACSRTMDGDWIVATVAWKDIVIEGTTTKITNISSIGFTLNKVGAVYYESIVYAADSFNSLVNEETGEYLLLSGTDRFLTMISNVEYPATKAIENDALKITQSATQTWWQGGVKVAFPQQIAFAEINTLTLRVKTDDVTKIRINLLDEHGNTCYLHSGSNGVTKSIDGDWTILTIDMATMLARTDADNHFTTSSTKLAGLQICSSVVGSVIYIETLTYTKK